MTTGPFDPADPRFLADPYPTFARVRARGPVHWHEGLGMFVAVSHRAADVVLRDRALGRLWRDKEPAELYPAFNLLHRRSILESEPPTHTRLRRLVAGAFGRGHVERMRPWISELADSLVTQFAERARVDGSADLLALVAEPLPVEVIAQLLGVPAADRANLRPWSNAIVKMYEYGLPLEGRVEAETAARLFVAYLRSLVADRLAAPREEDLVTDLVVAASGADRLTEDEIVGTCVLLLMAGHEATVNVIGNGMLAMLRNPGQWRRMVDDADLVIPAAEEMIRYDSSLQIFERTATRPVEVFGTRVDAGQKIAVLFGAANRDLEVFDEPDRFDIGRTPNPHVGFGAGIHFCLGAPLARVEVQAVLAALRRRLPRARLAAEPTRRPEFVIRGLTGLQVSDGRDGSAPRHRRGLRDDATRRGGEPGGPDPGSSMATMTEPFAAVDVIRRKRDGGELGDEQIDWVVDAYTRGAVAEEQMAALAMAILLNGMTRREISRWTAAMIATGERLDFSDLGRPTADKHSTGGVGDKITLPLAPLVAAHGVAVPQLSGRGLGHTGGTLDKLESIPGWRASLSTEEMTAQLRDVGAVVCAAGGGLAPADRKLYALRDVTATVESIPLIASSIMSKKIAEGTGALVLDVKVGSGAFMRTADAARDLARTMVDLGTDAGVRTVALLTDMSTPLGLTAGNALEVRESLDVLAGGGPPDVVELTLALAREMLAAAGRDGADPADALADGRAMDTWRRMITAQGGDPDGPLPVARETHAVLAPADGVLVRLDALAVGTAAWRLGAGRSRKEDPVQAAAGVELHAKPGAKVRGGEPLLTLHTDTPERFEAALRDLRGGVEIAPEGSRPAPGPLVLDRIA